MRKMFNKIAILIGVVSISVIAMVSCASEKEMNLLDFYMGFSEELTLDKFNKEIKKIDNDKYSVIRDTSSEIINLKKKEVRKQHLIKVIENNTEDKEELEVRFYQDDNKFASIDYKISDKHISKNSKGMLTIENNDMSSKIPNVNDSFSFVKNIEAQKTFINTGEISKKDISYLNRTIFDNIIPNSIWEDNGYNKNLDMIRKITLMEMTSYEINELNEDGKKYIQVLNKNAEKEELLFAFDEKNTLDTIIYIDKFGRTIGVKNKENEGLTYVIETGENKFEERDKEELRNILDNNIE